MALSVRLRSALILISLALLYILLVRLAGRYNNYPYGDWHSEIYADKAGYYIYLPAAFLHGFYQEAYPDDIEARLGHGFRFEEGRLFTKYPMGVAVMVSPFFLAAHLLALSGDQAADGFSGDYYEMSYYASVFYLLLGGWCLFLWLRKKFPLMVAVGSVLFVLFGTNLYFYAFRDPLMSHVYSFALFSMLLLFTERLWNAPGVRRLVPVAIVGGLIVLVRPVNAIFLPMILFPLSQGSGGLLQRLRFLASPAPLLTLFLITALILLPQLAYWKFISGRFLFNAYQGEGFTNWDSPLFAEVLFSPAGGLFAYTPGILLALAGSAVMIIRKEPLRWSAPLYFMAVLSICSVWYDYRFGCSFGQRSFTEYFSLFALPVASLVSLSFSRLRRIPGYFLVSVMVYLIYLNTGLTGIHTKCHFGEDWEWPVYRAYYERAGLFPYLNPLDEYVWKDDFEGVNSIYASRMHIVEDDGAYSGKFVSRADTVNRYADGFTAEADHIITGRLDRIIVGFKYRITGDAGSSAVVCSLETADTMSYYALNRIDQNGIEPGKWNDVVTEFEPDGIKAFGLLKLYVWRLSGQEIMIDDFAVQVVRKND